MLIDKTNRKKVHVYMQDNVSLMKSLRKLCISRNRVIVISTVHLFLSFGPHYCVGLGLALVDLRAPSLALGES
jgi:hypothetical protein